MLTGKLVSLKEINGSDTVTTNRAGEGEQPHVCMAAIVLNHIQI